MPASAINPSKDIIDTILREGVFRKLLGAFQSLNMVDVLKGAGPFTLLAPTDEAFAKLPESMLQDLEKPINRERLKSIIEGHIIKGRHDARDLESRGSLTALNGANYPAITDAHGTHVGGTGLIGHDMLCTNGVIHAIDTVLGV